MEEVTRQMIMLAHNALAKAYAPYSHFKVSACIASADQFFTGVNVENASYGLTLCAESAAIAKMVSHGFYHIDSIVILSAKNILCPPCGACRQRIHEFADNHTLIHLCDNKRVLQSHKMEELLPLAFALDIENE